MSGPAAIRSVAVLGAGHGGLAAAADLTLRGFDVTLHARSEARLTAIRERGGLAISGLTQAFVKLKSVTTDLAKAVVDADCVMIVVPSTAHEAYAVALAPFLRPDQIVLVNPGHTFGGLHVAAALRRGGFKGVPLVCETVTLSYVCREEAPATIGIYKHTDRLRFGAFPGRLASHLIELVRPLLPNVIAATDVLEMGMSNINAIFHPPGMIMNAGWIERTNGNFLFYAEGMTSSPGRATEAVDRERMNVAKALDIGVIPFLQHFHEAGLTTTEAMLSGSVSRACEESTPNATIRSPSSLTHRYVLEDVGYGLVPMAHLGRIAGVATPTIDALIQLAAVSLGCDFMSEGRTLDRLGLSGIAPQELKRFVLMGDQTSVYA